MHTQNCISVHYNYDGSTYMFIYFSKPLRLLYSLIIYEIVNFSFFALYSLLLLSFFLYLKSVPIHVIVHVYITYVRTCKMTQRKRHAGIISIGCCRHGQPILHTYITQQNNE